MGRTLVIGDIHGGHKALLQCLERSKFDYGVDTLICLGDVADGWPEVPQCIEELLKIGNLIYVMGNHDYWLDDWLHYGNRPLIWTEQGGQATIDAYIAEGDKMVKHRDFFNRAVYYHVDDQGRIFVHGGFQRGIKISAQEPTMFMWDRSLADKAAGENNKKTHKFTVHDFKEVYLGHTSVNNYSNLPANLPHKGGNVWLLDTGGGWEGKLTIMELLDTGNQYWQSDIVASLYPDFRGRSGRRFNNWLYNER